MTHVDSCSRPVVYAIPDAMQYLQCKRILVEKLKERDGLSACQRRKWIIPQKFTFVKSKKCFYENISEKAICLSEINAC